MPSTRPRPTDRPQPHISKEGTRTAIIVAVIVGTCAIILLVVFLRGRRIRRSAKAGTRTSFQADGQEVSNRPLQRHDKELEVGVIQEPLPVYQKEPMEDETRLAIAATRSSERRNDGVEGFRESPNWTDNRLASSSTA